MDPSTGVCPAVTPNYNVSDVKAWLIATAADPGGTAPSISNSAGTSSATLNGGEANAEIISLNFASGVANFSLASTDVGQYSIQFLDDSLNFSDQEIRGGSATLVARPFGFNITALGNPGATSSLDSVFTEAGQDFSVTVQAKAWASADDSDDDGIPDFYVDTDNGNNNKFTTSLSIAYFSDKLFISGN